MHSGSASPIRRPFVGRAAAVLAMILAIWLGALVARSHGQVGVGTQPAGKRALSIPDALP
jgi:hypothetical protein